MSVRRLDDDDEWDVHRGRLTPSTSHELRRSHDPLVSRMLDLRRNKGVEIRRQIDLLKYGKRGQRVYRLRKKALHNIEISESEREEIFRFDLDLSKLYARLPKKKGGT